jgi:uridine phosphorylase
VHTGDVVIATAAIRDEGTTSHYLPMEFPAVAHIEVVNALMAGAADLGVKTFTGVCQSKDSFYGEVERARMPMAQQLEDRWNAWIAAGALASEMEAAALFILCAIYRKRAGAALQVINEFDLAEVDEEDAAKHMAEFDADRVIKVAIAGLKHLIETDKR